MEEEKIGEQPETGSLGKFKDAESLLEAYNNLQAEFTKKCQKLSALEKEDAEAVFSKENWNEKVSTFLQQNADAKQYSAEISDYILSHPELKCSDNALEIAWSKIAMQNYVSPEKLIEKEDFIENYILSNDDIKKKVLELCARDLKPAPPVIGLGGDNFSSKQAGLPTTMEGAKKMVELLFK